MANELQQSIKELREYMGNHVMAANLERLIGALDRCRETLGPFASIGLFMSGYDADVVCQFYDLKLTTGQLRAAHALHAELGEGKE